MDAPVNDKVDVHVFCLCVFKLDTHQKADLLWFDFCRCKTCFCSIEGGGVLLCLKRKRSRERTAKGTWICCCLSQSKEICSNAHIHLGTVYVKGKVAEMTS